MLCELDICPFTLPIVLNSDSQSAIDLIERGGLEKRTKHISRRYYFLKDDIVLGNIILSFVRSEDQEADFLTKALSKAKMDNCLIQVQLCDFARKRGLLVDGARHPHDARRTTAKELFKRDRPVQHDRACQYDRPSQRTRSSRSPRRS